MTELKDCPFCGGRPRIRTEHETIGFGWNIDFYRVYCHECGVGIKSEDKYKAIEAWNRRVTDETEHEAEKTIMKFVQNVSTIIDNNMEEAIRMSIIHASPELEAEITINPREVAIALGKHTKRKPVPARPEATVCPVCPNCRDDVIYGQKYCSYCGQRLDWSD